MTTKSELILDIGGVLATNIPSLFWQELSTVSKNSHEAILKIKNEIREELWTGSITLKEYWSRFSEQFPTIESEMAQKMILSYIKPLPAIQEIPKWSQVANIHILSNHRIEWIQPILNMIQNHIKTVTVSSEVGSLKPHAEIYSVVHSKLQSEKNILFVDDIENNLDEAKALGWNTLLADEKGNWIQKVLPHLSQFNK